VLQYCVLVHCVSEGCNTVYNGAQRYEQFLQVGWLYRALILLGLALCLSSASVSSVLMVLYRYYFFCLHPSLYRFVSWAWWDWPLTWLTNHRPSVLWHCWLGHVTRKTVSEMTYNVSSGTLNSTVPYRILYMQSRILLTDKGCMWTQNAGRIVIRKPDTNAGIYEFAASLLWFAYNLHVHSDISTPSNARFDGAHLRIPLK